jgi:hypothetical protein
MIITTAITFKLAYPSAARILLSSSDASKLERIQRMFLAHVLQSFISLNPSYVNAFDHLNFHPIALGGAY